MTDFETWWEETKSIVSNSDRVFAGSVAKIAYEAGKAEGFDSGRKAGLEEAARTCSLLADEVYDTGITTNALGFMYQDYSECAAAIREKIK